VTRSIRDCANRDDVLPPRAADRILRSRPSGPKWRNWQTRTFEGRVGQPVGVRVPPSAPTNMGGLPGPPNPPTLGAPRRSRGAPRIARGWVSPFTVFDFQYVRRTLARSDLPGPLLGYQRGLDAYLRSCWRGSSAGFAGAIRPRGRQRGASRRRATSVGRGRSPPSRAVSVGEVAEGRGVCFRRGSRPSSTGSKRRRHRARSGRWGS
jgi:hypothetical protein